MPDAIESARFGEGQDWVSSRCTGYRVVVTTPSIVAPALATLAALLEARGLPTLRVG